LPTRAKHEQNLLENVPLCENKTAYILNQQHWRTAIPLTHKVVLYLDDGLRKAPFITRDSTIIGLACRDILAAEACYHDQCFSDYTWPDKASMYTDMESRQPDSGEAYFLK